MYDWFRKKLSKKSQQLIPELLQNPVNIPKLSGELQHDLNGLRAVFNRASDVIFREFLIGGQQRGSLIYVDGMADTERIDVNIMQPLLREISEQVRSELTDGNLLNLIEQHVLSIGQLKKETDMDKVIDAILSGDAVVLADGSTQAFVLGVRKWESRGVEEPATEPVIRGPREGFTENLRTNTVLVRRRLKTTQLKMEYMKIGRLSKTDVVVAYLEQIVQEDLVEEVRNRLGRIKTDAILESGYIEELIEDNAFSIFPQILNTERPDRFVSQLLEGKVGIIVDNTPFALVMPASFFDMLEASEDYYQRYIPATATRWLRFWLAFSALVFPSVYIAVLTYHQEMVPTTLLFSIAASREAVPFPAIVEAFLMELAFEGLREAGVRLPRPVGQAVSIVGALVIGQAAVQAGIVSASLVIVVSFTGIASFIFPTYSLGFSVRMLRFPLMILAGTLGLYGILLGLMTIMIHMARLRSFGVSYLEPFASFSYNAVKDTLMRAPWWSMIQRPAYTSKKNLERMNANLRPKPPEQGG